MIRVKDRGDRRKAKSFLNRLLNGDQFSDLDTYGRLGVDALSSATPVDSGLTARSWNYRVIRGERPGVQWYNTNEVSGTPVAILIQYGHGTGTGGYVQGKDYINPAMRPIFDKIAEDIGRKVRA